MRILFPYTVGEHLIEFRRNFGREKGFLEGLFSQLEEIGIKNAVFLRFFSRKTQSQSSHITLICVHKHFSLFYLLHMTQSDILKRFI